MKKILIHLSVGILLLGAISPSVNAADQQESIGDAKRQDIAKTRGQIKEQWLRFQPSFKGNPFVTEPSISKPYLTGSLVPEFISDGVNMANFVRYLADIPYDLETTESLNVLSQHGAVLLTASKEFEHVVSKPTDMDENFYKIGSKSILSSNLSMRSSHKDSSLNQAVLDFMSDSDDENIAHVGHRRSILNPSLKYVGFGSAYTQTDNNGSVNTLTTMHILDSSRKNVNFNYVLWPNKGNFPSEFFQHNDAWSIMLNPSQFKNPSLDQVKVKVTRKYDNKTWILDKEDNHFLEGKDYFNIDINSYGNNYAVIFRPGQLEFSYFGDYEVTVTGLKSIGDKDITINYTVKFFNLIDELTSSTVLEPATQTFSFVAADNGTLYYLSRGKLFKKIEGLGKPSQIGEGNIVDFLVKGDWIYFRKYQGGVVVLCKMKTDGTNYSSLTKHNAVDVSIVGDIIYVNRGRMLSNGNLLTGLFPEASVGHIKFHDKKIFHTREDKKDSTEQLYVMNTDGTNIQRITNDTFEESNSKRLLNIEGDWIFYLNSSDGGARSTLYKIGIDGQNQRKVVDDNILDYQINENQIYYYSDGSFGPDGIGIYKINTDGTEKTKILASSANEIKVIGDWVYFIKPDFIYSEDSDTYIDNSSLSKVKTNGTDYQPVSQ